MIKEFIKSTQKKLEKIAKTKSKDSLYFKTYSFLLTKLRPVYFSNEFLLLKGLKRKSSSSQQSILFFTVHKSASTFIKHTIIKIIGNEELVPINLGGLLSLEDQIKHYNNKALMSKVLKEKGFYYIFRSYNDFPDLNKFKILLVLRDPRDVLTSHYFSTLFNHPLSRIEVIEDREKYSNLSIDEFVLKYAIELAAEYADYCNYLLPRENVLLLKYEDMVERFPSWLHKLSAFLTPINKEDVLNKIIDETSFVVKKEDKNSFIRNIKPGDHKNKLRPETIDALNKLFYSSMLKLGYEI